MREETSSLKILKIGGGFRVPDILRKAGVTLREVGTTNRTRASDYAAALTPATRLILRVHRSNFRIEGFTHQPTLAELLELSKRAGVPVFEDQGTGLLLDLAALTATPLEAQASFLTSALSPLPLVACSGDKLLGGPQCGLLVGDRALIDRIHANPLLRALRVDKLTYAALEATLRSYLNHTHGTIPTLAMLQASAETIRSRCETLASILHDSPLQAEIIPTESVIGGGTTPGATLPSFALAITHPDLSESALAARLRHLSTPVIARIQDARVLLDLRTVLPAQDDLLHHLLQEAFASPHHT